MGTSTRRCATNSRLPAGPTNCPPRSSSRRPPIVGLMRGRKSFQFIAIPLTLLLLGVSSFCSSSHRSGRGRGGHGPGRNVLSWLARVGVRVIATAILRFRRHLGSARSRPGKSVVACCWSSTMSARQMTFETQSPRAQMETTGRVRHSSRAFSSRLDRLTGDQSAYDDATQSLTRRSAHSPSSVWNPSPTWLTRPDPGDRRGACGSSPARKIRIRSAASIIPDAARAGAGRPRTQALRRRGHSASPGDDARNRHAVRHGVRRT